MMITRPVLKILLFLENLKQHFFLKGQDVLGDSLSHLKLPSDHKEANS